MKNEGKIEKLTEGNCPWTCIPRNVEENFIGGRKMNQMKTRGGHEGMKRARNSTYVGKPKRDIFPFFKKVLNDT